MPSLALPHAPHPQEALVQHQGLQSFRRWELCDVPPLMPSPGCHSPSFREWCLLPSLSLSLTSRLSFPPFYPHPSPPRREVGRFFFFFIKGLLSKLHLSGSSGTWENGWNIQPSSVRINAWQSVQYQEARTIRCLCGVHSFLIIDTFESIIPLTPLSLSQR